MRMRTMRAAEAPSGLVILGSTPTTYSRKCFQHIIDYESQLICSFSDSALEGSSQARQYSTPSVFILLYSHKLSLNDVPGSHVSSVLQLQPSPSPVSQEAVL
jgi:hypothetical protein